jgi:hypothetical protein
MDEIPIDLLAKLAKHVRQGMIEQLYGGLLELLDAKWSELAPFQVQVLKHNYPEVYQHCQLAHEAVALGGREI